MHISTQGFLLYCCRWAMLRFIEHVERLIHKHHVPPGTGSRAYSVIADSRFSTLYCSSTALDFTVIQ